MTQQPIVETARLLLRPFSLADAPVVQKLAGDRAIALTTLNIPHPYEDGMAEEWIGSHQGRFEHGEAVTFAIVRRADGTLMGALGLEINQKHNRAELGYWMGKPYWNQGYCTEAAEAAVRYGFETLGLRRIHAFHLRRNPASGRVMQKVGMVYEGSLRKHVQKWGEFEDLEMYGILREDWAPAATR